MIGERNRGVGVQGESQMSSAGAREPDVKTPDAEKQEILERQKIEAEWYQDIPGFETEEDIDYLLEHGDLVKIEDAGLYRVSANIPREKFRVLRPNTKDMLDKVATRWEENMKAAGESMEKTALIVSSLTRTNEYQRELIAKGYPAAEDSTHTKGGAFDIGIKWFEQNRPEVANIVKATLQELADEGEINYIPEPSIGALHVAVNPNFRESQ